MPLFKCEWPNGDVSFVLANDIRDAIVRLDEFGAAEPEMIERLSEFMIDLKPNRKVLEANARARRADKEEEGFPWELGEVGECLLDPEAGILPAEDETLRRLRKFEKEGKAREREHELRTRALREGTLVDLSERRQALAMKRSRNLLGERPSDEP